MPTRKSFACFIFTLDRTLLRDVFDDIMQTIEWDSIFFDCLTLQDLETPECVWIRELNTVSGYQALAMGELKGFSGSHIHLRAVDSGKSTERQGYEWKFET